ncbi:hypothetical protein EYC84_000493 [Monilinia fructicola]|uniref:Uncharacterized protein n=1 Tax=Monilinia fructicola TaxID=38448 RepID=A0A5M9JNR1_MONFR|nr:hypothetical protein EYC84_000493 [Monilinia fructicola]
MPSIETTPSNPTISGKMAENKNSIKVLDDLMSKLTVSKEQTDINAATHNLAVFINVASRRTMLLPKLSML